PGSTNDALGVLIHIIAFAWLEGILVLCFHVAAADVDDVQFVGADAAIEEFLAAGFGVKRPFTLSLHDGHRERAVLVAYNDECAGAVLRIHRDTLLFSGLGSEVGGALPVLGKLPCKNDVVAAGTEDSLEIGYVELLGGSDEGGGSLL